MKSLWLKATLLCGTLDLVYAIVATLLRQGDALAMLRGVAAGPFGDAANGWGLAGSLLGLGVHFAIMGVMAAVAIWLARNTLLGEVAPWKAGTLYGLVLYSVMYGVVLHQRFGAPFPNPDRIKLAIGLFPHIFFVGIPLFWLARRAPQANAAALRSN